MLVSLFRFSPHHRADLGNAVRCPARGPKNGLPTMITTNLRRRRQDHRYWYPIGCPNLGTAQQVGAAYSGLNLINCLSNSPLRLWVSNLNFGALVLEWGKRE
jgi:hypothetical protein